MKDGAFFAVGVMAVAGTLNPCSAFVLRLPSTATFNTRCSSAGGNSFCSNKSASNLLNHPTSAGNRRRNSRIAALGMMAGGMPPAKDIFEALMAGDDAGVNEYVDAGGDCAVRDSIGDTPLMLAVESEMTTAVTKLAREGGADVNQGSETTGETPLQLAAYYGYTHLARVLVGECGADVELRNKKGDTALGLASYWGNTDTVEYLLESGANPDVANKAGERPGEKFDTVFVPQGATAGEPAAGPEGSGPREKIIDMLNEARAARKLASV